MAGCAPCGVTQIHLTHSTIKPRRLRSSPWLHTAPGVDLTQRGLLCAPVGSTPTCGRVDCFGRGGTRYPALTASGSAHQPSVFLCERVRVGREVSEFPQYQTIQLKCAVMSVCQSSVSHEGGRQAEVEGVARRVTGDCGYPPSSVCVIHLIPLDITRARLTTSAASHARPWPPVAWPPSWWEAAPRPSPHGSARAARRPH